MVPLIITFLQWEFSSHDFFSWFLHFSFHFYLPQSISIFFSLTVSLLLFFQCHFFLWQLNYLNFNFSPERRGLSSRLFQSIVIVDFLTFFTYPIPRHVFFLFYILHFVIYIPYIILFTLTTNFCYLFASVSTLNLPLMD